MKQVTINGKAMDVSREIETIEQLIDDLSLKSPVIIVEHNKHILQKEDHPKTIVQEGDTVEFVQFVGGG